MLRVILSITVVLASHAVAQEQRHVAMCEGWAEFAYMTMRMRQDGVLMSTAFEAARATHVAANSPESDIRLSHLMIARAYQHPLEETDRLAEVAAIRFSEEALLACLKAAAG